MNNEARKYIKKLHLKKHPEGGYYREIYRSGELILPAHLPKRYKTSRNFSTSIYFLLEGKQFSAFHLLQTDELWHFYDGSDIIIYIISKRGKLYKKKLGKADDAQFQITIKKHSWFAAEVEDKNSFALFGCTVSPGFEFEDFELGRREILLKKYPKYKTIIQRFTRSD